jgi:hypothetical protein
MKILITESQFKNILDEYLNRIIKKPEYDFVDHIEVIEGTTKRGNWRNEHIVPYYEYVVYLNDYNPLVINDNPLVSRALSDLYDKIGDTHAILFPVKEDGSPRAYYSIDRKFF